MKVLFSILVFIAILVFVATRYVTTPDDIIQNEEKKHDAVDRVGTDAQVIVVITVTIIAMFALNHYLVDIVVWGNMLFS